MPKDKPEKDELNQLIERANDGDDSAMAALREAIPSDQWNFYGDLGRQARLSLIDAMSGGSKLTYSAVGRRVRELHGELALETDGELETLLIDCISTNWLALHHAEAMRNQDRSGSIRQSEFYDRQVTDGQKRYLASIKTLAQVRRLLRPSIQVNIAEKQVNVAG